MYKVTVKIRQDKTQVKADVVYRVDSPNRKQAKLESMDRIISELGDGEYILNFDIIEVQS